MRGQPQDGRRPRHGLARWLQPWRESEVVASALDLARESFVEPWSELGQEFVEATRPLARRGAAAAGGRQQAGDISGGAPAATFPAPPHDNTQRQAPQAAFEHYEEAVVQPRRPTVSRPLIPGDPPQVGPSYRGQAGQGQGTRSASWTAHLVQGGAAADEVQRHVEAQEAFLAAQQRTSGAGSASLGLYTPHMPQFAARPPLPPGTAVLVGPPQAAAAATQAARLPSGAMHNGQRVSQPHERPDSDARSSGGGGSSQLAVHLDSMFDAIHSQPPGATPSDADAWAAMRMAEHQRAAQAAEAARAGGARGPSTAGAFPMQPLSSSRGTSAQQAPAEHVSGERLRAVNAAAEAARQRLAALRVAHPDSFPAGSARALYTPWTDVHAAEVDKGWGGGADAEEAEVVETHVTAKLLGQRWRVVVAAVVVALTLVLYARDVVTGAGADAGVPHKLLMWHAGEAAGWGPPPPAPPLPPGVAVAAGPPGPLHHGLHLVVEVDEEAAVEGGVLAEHGVVDVAAAAAAAGVPGPPFIDTPA